MHPKELSISDFTYDLPDERIARFPLPQRDASRLLIYENGVISEDTFSHLDQYLSPGALIVFNRTKVVRARLLFRKPTGGVIELFCLEPTEKYADIPTAMQQKRQVEWYCMVGGAAKWKDGTILHLEDTGTKLSLTAELVKMGNGSSLIRFGWNNADLCFAEVLHLVGKVPLPPYLKREVDIMDTERYQTVFAATEGSVAAPTASLHFSEAVLDSLPKRGVKSSYVTLHVGAGTFMPVKATTMDGHEMHAEWIEVEKGTVRHILYHLDKGIIAAGTTALRTLESLYWIGNKLNNDIVPDFEGIAVDQWDAYGQINTCDTVTALEAIVRYMHLNSKEVITTRTQILIAPGYQFRVANQLITNFHQPGSTLLLLVAAFVGSEWKHIYAYALLKEFRFLSYGDASLLKLSR